jgi:hypothetical protein
MKTTLSIIGIASLALVGLSSEALAQGPRDIRSEACLSSVPLTYQQQRQIDGFRASASYESRQVRFQIDRAEAELRTLTFRHRPYRMAIARQESELRDLRAREQNIWTTYEWQVQSMLGPAQRISLARCSAPVRPLPVVATPIWTSHPVTVVSVHTPNPSPIHAPGPRPMGRR